MNDSDNNLASNTIHLTERFNQALGADIEYRANADNKERFSALAELENVRDNLDAILAKHRADQVPTTPQSRTQTTVCTDTPSLFYPDRKKTPTLV